MRCVGIIRDLNRCDLKLTFPKQKSRSFSKASTDTRISAISLVNSCIAALGAVFAGATLAPVADPTGRRTGAILAEEVDAAGARLAVLAAGARVVADVLAELDDIDEGVAPRL